MIFLTKDHARIRVELEVQHAGGNGLPLGQLVDHIAIHIGGDDAGVELVDRNPATFIGLRLEPERVGTNAEVGVHRDENERLVRVLVSEVERHLQDEAVHLAGPARALGHLLGDSHSELATCALEGHPLIEGPTVLIAKLVEDTREVPRVLPELTQLFLELIDLFDDEDR
jgi:hypothetical protein